MSSCLCHLNELISQPCSCFVRNQATADEASIFETTGMPAPTAIPMTSAVSLMVGEVPTITPQSENDILQEKISSPASLVEEDQPDEEAVEELKSIVRKAWDDEPESTTIGNNCREDCAALLEKMLADRPQLIRILIARKYQMEACMSLFFEQLRFRARWKPESIQPEDIPNALPCKLTRVIIYCRDALVKNVLLTFSNSWCLETGGVHKRWYCSEQLQASILETGQVGVNTPKGWKQPE